MYMYVNINAAKIKTLCLRTTFICSFQSSLTADTNDKWVAMCGACTWYITCSVHVQCIVYMYMCVYMYVMTVVILCSCSCTCMCRQCWECLAEAYLARGSHVSALKTFSKVVEVQMNNMYIHYHVWLLWLLFISLHSWIQSLCIVSTSKLVFTCSYMYIPQY